jgi:hypothetical protein
MLQLTAFGNFDAASIDLSATGKIVVATPQGWIFLTDESLNGFTAFHDDFAGFANFVQPPPGTAVVPELPSASLLGVGAALLGLVQMGCRRSRLRHEVKAG